ncbi:MAG TPA: iron uptake porin [Leptolyngbyaceae cyanobacterium]
MNQSFEKSLKLGLFSLVNTLLIANISRPELAVAENQANLSTIDRSHTEILVAEESVVESNIPSLNPTALDREVGTQESDPMNQVTGVSQLRDVSPEDWAYQALQSLVERYGCIEGYPDRTFRGNRALTRYEFAAGLNACLQQIESLIAATNTDNKNPSLLGDIETLRRLTEEFQTELTTLRNRVDQLERRVTMLESTQFSTTTKYSAEIVFAAAGVFGEENAATGDDLDEQVAFGYRVRQSFLTSFTGRDRLRIRLQSGNLFDARGGSNITNLNTFGSNSSNDVRLNKLEYRFPIGNSTMVWLTAHNMNLDDVADPLAPFTNSAVTGANSGFGAYAPIYYTSFGAGAGISHDFTKQLNLALYYSAGNSGSPNEDSGFFNGQYVAGSQLTYKPSNDTAIGLVYTHNYFPGKDTGFVSGGVGSALADDPFQGNATSTDNFGIVGTWRITRSLNLEGWGIYTRATARGGTRDGDTADILNWKLSLAFPDLFKEGNLGVLTVGNPPQAYRVEGGLEDDETAWFVEAFYTYQVNDYVSITPGVFLITNPEDNREPLLVGILRLGFSF